MKPIRPSASDVAMIQRILDVVGANLWDVPALPELARMANMNRARFSALFHAVVGVSFRIYIPNLRLDHAQALLRTTRQSLTAVAVDCGFYDLAHLDKAFRKRFHMSPSQFRRLHTLGGATEPTRPVTPSRPRPVGSVMRPRSRPIAGASDAELIATLLSTAPVCPECLARRAGVPEADVETTLDAIATTLRLVVDVWTCAACHDAKTTVRLLGPPPVAAAVRPAPIALSRREPPRLNAPLWRYLEAHRGEFRCAACLAAAIGTGKRVDRALMAAEGRGAQRRYGRCATCGRDRLVCGLSP